MDVDLYFNTRYAGFYPINVILDLYVDYHDRALKFVETLPDDEIVLFAIYGFEDSDRPLILSADFMMVPMPRERYIELCHSLNEFCTLHIVSKKS